MLKNKLIASLVIISIFILFLLEICGFGWLVYHVWQSYRTNAFCSNNFTDTGHIIGIEYNTQNIYVIFDVYVDNDLITKGYTMIFATHNLPQYLNTSYYNHQPITLYEGCNGDKKEYYLHRQHKNIYSEIIFRILLTIAIVISMILCFVIDITFCMLPAYILKQEYIRKLVYTRLNRKHIYDEL